MSAAREEGWRKFGRKSGEKCLLARCQVSGNDDGSNDVIFSLLSIGGYFFARGRAENIKGVLARKMIQNFPRSF